MRRRRSGSIAGDPLLIGAVTIFLSVVVVYFVYKADSGLPFVPQYSVRAVLPDAQNVARNAEVRIAGIRVGRVGERAVRTLPGGGTEAVLELELDKSVEPLPAGTSMRMRATSTLGGNYVEVLPGHGTTPLRGPNPTIRAGRDSALPTLGDALEAFDPPTRRGVQRSITGYGEALVGRGDDLNGFVAEAPRTLRRLDGTARILAAPATGLSPFIDGFARLGAAVVPVADEQAGLFVGLDRTLAALASVRGSVAESAARAPGALDAGIEGFPRQRRLLRATSALFASVAPGVRAASGAATDIEGAAVAGPPAMRALQSVSPELASTGRALERFSEDPAVVPSLKTLTGTFQALKPTVADLRSSQVVCNYPGVLLRNLLSAVSDGDSVGNWLTTVAVFHLPGTNAESGPSAAPANGPGRVDKLHTDPYPYSGRGPDGPECEAGNESYTPGQVIGHPPGRQQAATEATGGEGGGG